MIDADKQESQKLATYLKWLDKYEDNFNKFIDQELPKIKKCQDNKKFCPIGKRWRLNFKELSH